MDPVQLVIIIVTIVLTILVVVLGVQVWFILKEIRLSFQKINKMLDDAGRVSGTVSEGFSGMTGLVNGLKAGLSLFSNFRKKATDDEQ